MTPLVAFVTGISTGGLTCMAVQGGLLLGLLAQQKTDADQPSRRWYALLLPVAAFLLAKLVIYAALGLGLGALGSTLKISTSVSVWLQSIAGVFIVITGIRLFFPRWLPWLALTPPAIIRRFIRRQTKNDAWVAPAFLGLLTVLIPCGTTIAMETAAIATGSAVRGAAILGAFVLGTVPLFFFVGVLAKGATVVQRRLAWIPALIVIALGFYTLNGALVMIDSPYTVQNEVKALSWALSGSTTTTADDASSTVTINVRGNGYEPNEVTVPTGQPVVIKLAAADKLGCTSVFRIPKIKVEQQLTPGAVTPLNVTFPTAGQYTFSCGMGMYTGTINAI